MNGDGFILRWVTRRGDPGDKKAGGEMEFLTPKKKKWTESKNGIVITRTNFHKLTSTLEDVTGSEFEERVSVTWVTGPSFGSE